MVRIHPARGTGRRWASEIEITGIEGKVAKTTWCSGRSSRPWSVVTNGVADLQHCVRLTFLNNIDDQQLERLGPDDGTHVPLPHRFQDKISRSVRADMAGFHVGHAQVSR